MMTISDLQRRTGEINIANGWREDGDASAPTVEKAITMLALITTEVAEAIEDVRAGRAVDEVRLTINGDDVYRVVDGSGADWTTEPDGRPDANPACHATFTGVVPKPEGVPSELADVVIRALDAADAWGIDLGEAIEQKLAYNATRGYRHGGKRA